MGSTSKSGLTDLRLGPCEVKWGTFQSEADIGRTEGGVVVTFTEQLADLLSDQWGTAPEDQVVTGQGATVVVPMASITFDALARALKQTVLVGSPATTWLIKGASNVGTMLSDVAESLRLTRYDGGIVSTSANDRVTFPKCAPTGDIELSFSKDGQRVISTTFVAVPWDESTEISPAPSPAVTVLYYIGDDGILAQ
jgi:hypothetical protein